MTPLLPQKSKHNQQVSLDPIYQTIFMLSQYCNEEKGREVKAFSERTKNKAKPDDSQFLRKIAWFPRFMIMTSDPESKLLYNPMQFNDINFQTKLMFLSNCSRTKVSEQLRDHISANFSFKPTNLLITMQGQKFNFDIHPEKFAEAREVYKFEYPRILETEKKIICNGEYRILTIEIPISTIDQIRKGVESKTGAIIDKQVGFIRFKMAVKVNGQTPEKVFALPGTLETNIPNEGSGVITKKVTQN